jgi:histone H3/H4
MKACGAKTRGGGKCKKPAMPNGRCKLHGGKTPRGTDSVHFKHGRYSTVFRGQLADKFLHATEEDKPLDLLPELAVQRAVLASYIEKVSNKIKVEIGDFKAVSSLAEDVVRTAATIAKVRNDTALTIAEIKFIQIGMMRLLEKYVTDPNRRRDFIAELRALVPGRDDAGADEPAGVPLITKATSNTA